MKNRNRLDHHLPRGYLEGFTNPLGQGQLSVFDRHEKRWFESGTAGVGAIKGFYDYTEGSEPGRQADEAFKKLEAIFPVERRRLVESDFADWRRSLEVLLAFAQMIRARSLLFRDQSLTQSRDLTFLKIEEILPSEPSKSDPSQLVTPVRYSHHVPSEAELKDKAITDMQAEIAKGAAWMSEMDWCLRITRDADDPYVTCDTPLVMEGRVPRENALGDGETLIFFPLCWQACLVGSPAKFDVETDLAVASDTKKLHALYLRSAFRFLFSPKRIDLDA